MNFIFWLQFAAVCIAGAMSPGPSLALIIRNSITISRFAGFMTAIGHGIGMGVYAVFAVTGLIIILTTNEILFQFIQIIGILFLLFIGFQFLFKKNLEIENANNQKNFNTIMLFLPVNNICFKRTCSIPGWESYARWGSSR